MSRKVSNIDTSPLLDKVQEDVNFLCYLGLHQYAKEYQLIGRSRPMITNKQSGVKQRRLSFRLVVACIQQLIGDTHIQHGEEKEQVNYLNVGNYTTLRLYGILDKNLFISNYLAQTGFMSRHTTSTIHGYWPSIFNTSDLELLSRPGTSSDFHKAFYNDLTVTSRAILTVGGGIFTEKLRKAVSTIPVGLYSFSPHFQRDPKNRNHIKNIAINLKLYEAKRFTIRNDTTARRRTYEHNIPREKVIDAPMHIERLLEFKDLIWPWAEALLDKDTREACIYIANNFPSHQAIQARTKQIRESTEERNRLRRMQEEAEARNADAREIMRQRMLATLGEPNPNRPAPLTIEDREEELVFEPIEEPEDNVWDTDDEDGNLPF